MLDIFYNVWGGFSSHPALIILSIVGIYILGYILIFGNAVLLDSRSTRVVMLSAVFTTLLSVLFTVYSFAVKIYTILVIISGLVVLFN